MHEGKQQLLEHEKQMLHCLLDNNDSSHQLRLAYSDPTKDGTYYYYCTQQRRISMINAY
jgi:hypothetical protein